MVMVVVWLRCGYGGGVVMGGQWWLWRLVEMVMFG